MFKSRERCTSKDNGFYPGKPCGPPMHVHLNQVHGTRLPVLHMTCTWAELRCK